MARVCANQIENIMVSRTSLLSSGASSFNGTQVYYCMARQLAVHVLRSPTNSNSHGMDQGQQPPSKNGPLIPGNHALALSAHT